MSQAGTIMKSTGRRTPRQLVLAACAAVLPVLWSCDDSGIERETQVRQIAVTDIPSPAAAGSGEPNLAVDASGTVYLSWLEPAADSMHALRFAELTGDPQDVRTVASGRDFFVNWADFPSLLPLPGGALAAHWLVRSGDATYAYDVHVASSMDGGRSWSSSIIPHRDGTRTEHGFVSMFAEDGGEIGMVWLDGRNMAEDPGGGHGATDDHAGAGGMTLRYARLGPEIAEEGENRGGEVIAPAAAPLLGGIAGPRDEALLDSLVCDCCQTAAVPTTEGPLVVYRDRSRNEVRDIATIRRSADGWSSPRPVHRDGWVIGGCPVNGPAAVSAGDLVAVAWFTGAGDSARVLMAFSEDGGENFGAPKRIDQGSPTGRVDVELLPDGDGLVSWLEESADEGSLRIRRVTPGSGSMGPPLEIAEASTSRAGGFPRMARSGERLYLAWTEPGDSAGLRIVTTSLEAL